ncbi:SagB/ThcOx family dehydrogenase [Phormidium sp. LEGE 05292]|uniref:SagB/ThcOx family dehydrogenase n=1 Tax=[Phormidium] sp. LEGE 05292 TaxID=767427 RepID=UPI0018824801|nr:SagB/ThcOx family dehydrogenase [Phormidium sp. LEGE 05292]MBE9224348.1 SagB/ThcOx family dehydrogenase [Phormidium sp. LEGE 05292]
MLPKIIKNEYHEATKLSFLSVQIDPNYVDSSTQPAAFKSYPKFFRRFPLDLENPSHSFLHFTSAITWQKMYREGIYSLRVNPSAGALYPTEIYVQIRGIKGIIEGIYHLEVKTQSLTLIYELIDDGLEGYLFDNRLVKGYILLISCVYFRSSWKYKNRSLRYCFLDSGHHLGAIEASAYTHNLETQILFDFDRLALNDDLGLENKEFITSAIIVGDVKEKAVRRLRSPIPFVSGTDYFEPNHFVEAGYKATLSPTKNTQEIIQPQFSVDRASYLQAIKKRRSARRFHQSQITQEAFLEVWESLLQPIATQSYEAIEIYAIVQNVAGIEPGVYYQEKCLKVGNFRDKMGYLCVNQAIGRDCAVLFFFVSDCQNYRTALQLAGLLGQRVYLKATYVGLACSGIGAFFDDEVQAFLGTEGSVLYAVAIG